MADSPLDKLAQLFEQFPGIGKRQARRFAFFIARKENGFVSELSSAMKRSREGIRQCTESFQYFFDDTGTKTLSPIERDSSRDSTHLMIVEKDTDIESMERSGVFKGKYFVIGNLASLLDTEIETNKRVQSLVEKIKQRTDLEEVTFALPASSDGDRTTLVLRQLLTPALKERSVRLTELGRGLSTGTELEYADRHTLEEAWNNRR